MVVDLVKRAEGRSSRKAGERTGQCHDHCAGERCGSPDSQSRQQLGMPRISEFPGGEAVEAFARGKERSALSL
jgi:hypothetical protein